ncbi:hypothetical protein FG379_000154 [Cryptosporidium bovis]|uniref:uncharacterized protein n=1 Tax=Cryptosporidium bovis TaxID=310047 RepID=UPI003519EB93|nr:hypothetical protein FG379_000154 [Cryptosporidium bovis]
MSTSSGREVTVEDDPNAKYLIENSVELPKSRLWKILERYYETVSIDAWRKNQVPSFITSNSRLANGYARLIHSFIMDQHASNKSFKKVYIIEVGGGHGRFTYLLLRALEKYAPVWEDLGYTDVPFKYIFTDAIEASFSFLLRDSSVLVQFVERGWLDFARFNGNFSEPGDIFVGLNRNEQIPVDSSIVLVCNYVLDSLLTDALAINGDNNVSRATVSVYSTIEELDLTHPSIADRMTLTWGWKDLSYLDDQTEISERIEVNNDFIASSENDDGSKLSEKDLRILKYADYDVNLYKVIKSYLMLNREMSFVLPIGAIKMLRRFFEYTNGNICILIGDKGYPDDTEFMSIRPPHIAIHGCMSFMVNLDAMKKYFSNFGGSSIATRYKDTFQITCILGKRKSFFPRTIGSFIDSLDDLIPDNLLGIQKGFERIDLEEHSCSIGLKPFLGFLRYSNHDPFILWVLKKGILSTINDINIRQKEDIISDLRNVYKNVYPLESNIDVFDVLAQICLKGGFINEAIFYYNESLRCCPEYKHPSTFVNLAKCYQSQRNWKKAFFFCNEALKLDPDYSPALDFNSEYLNSSRRLNFIIVGCYSSWIFTDIIPTIQFDPMYNCIGVLPTSSTIDNAKKAFDNLEEIFNCSQENEVFNSSPVYFIDQLKNNKNIEDALAEVFYSYPHIEAVILDVPYSLLKPCVKIIWDNNKHLMTRSPTAHDVSTANELLDSKPPRSLWYDYSPLKFESSLYQVYNIIKQNGRLYAIHCKYDLPSEVINVSDQYKYDEIISRLIYTLSAIHIAIEGTLDWVFSPTGEGEPNKKTLFCGWSSPLRPRNDKVSNKNIGMSDEVHCTVTTEFVTWDKTLFQFEFHCDNCTVTLKKEGPIWLLLVRATKGRYETKIQCLGLQTANERFRKLCKDYNSDLYNSRDSVGFSAWWEAIIKAKQSPVHFSYKNKTLRN